jgi:hypothetical protein
VVPPFKCKYSPPNISKLPVSLTCLGLHLLLWHTMILRQLCQNPILKQSTTSNFIQLPFFCKCSVISQTHCQVALIREICKLPCLHHSSLRKQHAKMGGWKDYLQVIVLHCVTGAQWEPQHMQA